MAIMRNRPAAVARRVTGYSLAVDVVVAVVIGLVISSVLGWIIFFAGLGLIGLGYYNFTRVMRTRGSRY